jgi:hypothetical protein
MRAGRLFCICTISVLARSDSEDSFELHALTSDDECSLQQDGNCAFNALQLRGQSVEMLTNHNSAGLELELDDQSDNSAPSCKRYGCQAKYSSRSICQCNPNCVADESCCPDYHSHCDASYIVPPSSTVNGETIMNLYHQTSPEACKSILATGFQSGHGGWCGGGIYFASTPDDTRTKAITPHSGIGCMLEVKVNVGRVKTFPCCRLCGGAKGQQIAWTEAKLAAEGYDSITTNPGDGPEYIIYNTNRIVSMRTIPFNPAWTPKHMKR